MRHCNERTGIEHIGTERAGTEDTGARQKYLASGQTDPLPEVVSQVTADFRDAIRSHPGNTLDPDETTLPSGLT